MGCYQAKVSETNVVNTSKTLTDCPREVDDDEEERAFFEAKDVKNVGLMSQSKVDVLEEQRARPSDVTKVLHYRWIHHHFSSQVKKEMSAVKSKRRRKSRPKSFSAKSHKVMCITESERTASLLPEESALDFLKITHMFGIIHFNDVYEVTERKREPVGGAAKFADMVKSTTAEFIRRTGEKPLILFSGDCLNPSILSCATKGRHMVEIFNQIEVDVAVFGNHEFDFGVDHATKCIMEMNSVWLMSNVIDNLTQKNLGGGLTTYVLTRSTGLKIGFVGLVEEEWLDTLSTVNKDDVTYTDYVKQGKKLALELRAQGCGFLIALTHMRWPNDIRLAQEVSEFDIILGGHDHDYSVKSLNDGVVVKSGSDFRNFTSIDVYIASTGAIDVRLSRHDVTSSIQGDPAMQVVVNNYMNLLENSLDTCIGTIQNELNGKYEAMRTQETVLGNFVADIVAASTKADLVLINSGSFRSDGIHPKGEFRLNDLMTILPIADTVVTVLATGKQLLQIFENGVSKYPRMDGRFPQISGASFGFNPNADPGSRIIQETVRIRGQHLNLNSTYHLATKAYVARGKDGYGCLSKCPLLCDPDASPLLSTIIRNHFSNVRRLEEFEKNMNCKIKIALDGKSLSCDNDGIDVTSAFLSDLDDEVTMNISLDTIDRVSRVSRKDLESTTKGGHIPRFIALQHNGQNQATVNDSDDDKAAQIRKKIQNANSKNAKLLGLRAENPYDIAWQVTPLLEARIFHCTNLDVS